MGKELGSVGETLIPRFPIILAEILVDGLLLHLCKSSAAEPELEVDAASLVVIGPSQRNDYNCSAQLTGEWTLVL